ncbi:MAG: DNA polymerase I [Lachnospiraceae bacterium]|nr:DNA polymerase I [Lachnospiraceae bacterium]
MAGKLVLIDGHSILNRAFYGMPDLTNAEGTHTGAVYGFLNILFRITEEEKPDHLAVAFDVHAPTFRHEMYAAYKGTRKPMPEELRQQVPLMKEMLSAMGIRTVEKAGLEADDILGTLAKRAEAEGMEVALVSGDRDLLQIASEHICIRIPKTKRGGTEIEDYHASDVERVYGMSPERFIQLKALMGDTSDNVPGAPKVGEKTATELLLTYGTIDGIYERIDEIKKNAIRESLRENRELVDLSLKLVTIKTDCELPAGLADMVYGNPFTDAARELCRRLGFKALLARFSEISDTAVPAVTDTIRWTLVEDKSLPDGADTASLMLYPLNMGMYLLSFCSREGEAQLFYLKPEECIFFLRKLHGSVRRLVSFELKKVFELLYPGDEGRGLNAAQAAEGLEDVQLMAYLLNPLISSPSSDDIAVAYLGSSKAVYAEQFGKLDFGDAFFQKEEEFCTYAASQAASLYKLYPLLEGKLKESGMEELYRDMELPLSYVLYRMEQEGIAADKEALKAYGAELSERISELERQIYEAAGEEFNINSPKQLATILFEKMGIPGGKKTKTGYSTSAEVLEKLAEDVPFVREILEYRTYTKLKSTYADALAEFIAADGRIHTKFNQCVTATGRLSSADPNLQNIPMRTELGRRIRKVFAPKEGCVFADADYSQIELRILASLAGDEGLIEAYREGKDIHRITASKVFHVPFDEVTDLQRRNAKAVNFGIVYGISSFGLSQDLSISRQEAKEYIEQYFATYPGIKDYLERVKAEAKESGWSVTAYGRRRPIPELKSSNFMQRQFGERVAMNAPIQGTAADIMKRAMLRVYDRLVLEGLKSRMLLQIHDELLIETPVEEEEKVLNILREEMAAAADLPVALEVDAHSGRDWYEAK